VAMVETRGACSEESNELFPTSGLPDTYVDDLLQSFRGAESYRAGRRYNA
jgi:hypothetical protein